MNFLFEGFKRLLAINDKLDDEEEKDFEKDIVLYTEVINSGKYADSNTNTEHIEKLISALQVTVDDNQVGLVKEEQTNLANNSELEKTTASIPSNEQQVIGKEVKDVAESKADLVEISQFGRKRFINRLRMHVELLQELEGEEGCSVIPGDPLYKPCKFSRDPNCDFKLPLYKVPMPFFMAIEGNRLDILKLGKPMSMANYIERFRSLLWIEEAHQAIEMHSYDLSDVMFGRYTESLLVLGVPGLAEGRPSLMKGDRLYASSNDKRASSKYEGYIHDVRERDVIFKLNSNISVNTLIGLRFDVTFVRSRTPFRRCHHGVQNFEKKFFKQLLFPAPRNDLPLSKPKINLKEETMKEFRCFLKSLNDFQRRAVMNILKAESFPSPYIIFGPPGTGKTVTLVETILQIYARKKDSRILVCGNSNSSADMLAERLKFSGVIPKGQLLRLSAFYRMEKLIPKAVEDITLDLDSLNNSTYQEYRIIVTTCVQSGTLYDFRDRFDYVLIDEAGHANEPEATISIGLAKQDSGFVVLAGDFQQLGPVVVSPIAKSNGLQTSLLERLSRMAIYQRRPKDSVMEYDERYITQLKISYRSDPRVLEVSNRLFYNNELKFVIETPKKWMQLLKVDHPLVFHQVKGKDRREYLNPSWFNPNEALTCLTYVHRLYGAGLSPEQLGIITPYRRQIDKLNLLFDKCDLEPCKIATMEEFQGDEREIIIISTVRTREKNIQIDAKFNLGFLFDPKRFNVAVSRAKWMCIVIGDEAILKRDSCWVEFLKSAHRVVKPDEEDLAPVKASEIESAQS